MKHEGISTEVKWREGMNQQVKQKVVNILTRLSQYQYKNEYSRYLKYSQFYKVCINKYGSKSNSISKEYSNQQQYYNSIVNKFSLMRTSLSGFLFSFTVREQKEEKINVSFPKNEQNLEKFKRNADEFISEVINENLIYLRDIFTSKRTVDLKALIQQVAKKKCENQQDFQTNLRIWQGLVGEAINFNCYYQIIEQLGTTYRSIKQFKTNLSKKTVILHSNKILKNLHAYGLAHRQTDYK